MSIVNQLQINQFSSGTTTEATQELTHAQGGISKAWFETQPDGTERAVRNDWANGAGQGIDFSDSYQIRYAPPGATPIVMIEITAAGISFPGAGPVDPHVVGLLWINDGVLTISNG